MRGGLIDRHFSSSQIRNSFFARVYIPSLVRYDCDPAMANSTSSPTQPAFKVLVIVSRPLDQNELPAIADQWALVNGLATVKAPVYLHILRPPTIERLRNEILNGYEIIHFDGHGSFALKCPSCLALNAPGSRKCGRCSASLEQETPRGYLAFEQEDGRADPLAAEELADMLRASPARLVFLSACESAAGGAHSLAAALLQGGVPAVLGMKETVPVDATIALSRMLYAALGAGRSIREAFQISLPTLAKLPDSRETGMKAKRHPCAAGPWSRCPPRLLSRPRPARPGAGASLRSSSARPRGRVHPRTATAGAQRVAGPDHGRPA